MATVSCVPTQTAFPRLHVFSDHIQSLYGHRQFLCDHTHICLMTRHFPCDFIQFPSDHRQILCNHSQSFYDCKQSSTSVSTQIYDHKYLTCDHRHPPLWLQFFYDLSSSVWPMAWWPLLCSMTCPVLQILNLCLFLFLSFSSRDSASWGKWPSEGTALHGLRLQLHDAPPTDAAEYVRVPPCSQQPLLPRPAPAPPLQPPWPHVSTYTQTSGG